MSLEDKIKPEKVGDLVAFLEYMGSRVIDEMTCREAGPNQYPFFDNEFDKEWLLDANDCEESINEIIEQNPERLFHEPVIISPVSGDPTKVSLVISPSCFEPDPEFMTQTRLQ